jgi:hypothetical protein
MTPSIAHLAKQLIDSAGKKTFKDLKIGKNGCCNRALKALKKKN